ncbi:hypothetical protein VNO78_03448 [Psophocarpus tetragonolobus]|uniref:Pentatricopeptide repeat-containing protein n=1 Tax=Psophocarpus tetragonolobus TaxID=3891 RepID=A0AAN9T490_PSOTE
MVFSLILLTRNTLGLNLLRKLAGMGSQMFENELSESSGINPPLPFLNQFLIIFVSCGLLEDARHMFDKMILRDFNPWATLFVAYYRGDDYEEATIVFVNMLSQLVVHISGRCKCCLQWIVDMDGKIVNVVVAKDYADDERAAC